MIPETLEGLERILQQYSKSFAGKIFSEESSEDDDLMLVFSLTQAIKSQNRHIGAGDWGCVGNYW